MNSAYKKYLWFCGGIVTAILFLPIMAEALDLPFLKKSTQWLQTPSAGSALLSIALLTGDLFLPIPSSFIMTANGYLFGIVMGTLISLIGSTLAGLAGYLVGKYCRGFLRKWTSSRERAQGDAWMNRWGMFSVAFCAGATTLRLKKFLISMVPPRDPSLFPLSMLLPGPMRPTYRPG